MILVKDAMEEIGDATGLCADNADARGKLLRIANRIERRLILEMGSRARATVCLPIHEGVIALPEYAGQIRRAEIDGSPIYYQQAREAHWLTETRPFRKSMHRSLQDLGGTFATYRDWPGAHQFYALSDADEPEPVQLTLVGVDAANRRIAETILVAKADPATRPALSSLRFSNRFIALRKNPSRGYIHLFAYDPANHGQLWVSSLAPNEVNPELRRVRLPEGMLKEPTGSLFAEVELRHVPHSSPLEVYLINSREAIYHAAQALAAEDDDPAVFERSNNRAMSQLRKEARRDRGEMPRARVKLWPDLARTRFGRKD
jgi:hypothetical protein